MRVGPSPPVKSRPVIAAILIAPRRARKAGRLAVLYMYQNTVQFGRELRRIELFHLGIDDYVGKPIVLLELRARVQSMLSRKYAADRTRIILEATSLGVMVAALSRSERQADAIGMVLGFLLAGILAKLLRVREVDTYLKKLVS